jgi:hypothetical protein
VQPRGSLRGSTTVIAFSLRQMRQQITCVLFVIQIRNRETQSTNYLAVVRLEEIDWAEIRAPLSV